MREGGRKREDQMVMIPCVCHHEISGEDTPNPKEMIVKLVIKNNNKKKLYQEEGRNWGIEWHRGH